MSMAAKVSSLVGWMLPTLGLRSPVEVELALFPRPTQNEAVDDPDLADLADDETSNCMGCSPICAHICATGAGSSNQCFLLFGFCNLPSSATETFNCDGVHVNCKCVSCA